MKPGSSNENVLLVSQNNTALNLTLSLHSYPFLLNSTEVVHVNFVVIVVVVVVFIIVVVVVVVVVVIGSRRQSAAVVVNQIRSSFCFPFSFIDRINQGKRRKKSKKEQEQQHLQQQQLTYFLTLFQEFINLRCGKKP